MDKSSPPRQRPAKPGPASDSDRLRPVPAVSRAVSILRLLGRSAEPLGVKSIADQLGLVPSTCLHILRVLVADDQEIVRTGLATILGAQDGIEVVAEAVDGRDEIGRAHV